MDLWDDSLMSSTFFFPPSSVFQILEDKQGRVSEEFDFFFFECETCLKKKQQHIKKLLKTYQHLHMEM